MSSSWARGSAPSWTRCEASDGPGNLNFILIICRMALRNKAPPRGCWGDLLGRKLAPRVWEPYDQWSLWRLEVPVQERGTGKDLGWTSTVAGQQGTP